MPETDESLLGRLASEPEAACRILYERYASVLLRFLYRFNGNRARSEEILHDIFLEVLNGKAAQLPPGALKTWLFTVAKNKALNNQRRENHARNVTEMPAAADDAEETRATEKALEKLAASESRLPPELRETWRLRRAGLDYQQIAERLAIPVGTVKSRFHRLVLVLRKEMEE